LFCAFLLLAGLAFGLAGTRTQPVAAFGPAGDSNIPRGGALYDNWIMVMGVASPPGNMPLWSRQSTNTTGGADTWRCITCHGWDYQGKDGAYRSGSHFTGFPGVLSAKDKSVDEIVATLKGAKDPSHDYSKYLDETAMRDLAGFLTTALIDDSQYIDPLSLKVKGGDAAQGKELYDQRCASCHGADGEKDTFRFEGTDATLADLAITDPWRYLHKTRYGTPGTEMPIGSTLGWTPEEGRNVLLYSQSLPAHLLPKMGTPPLQQTRPAVPGQKIGGPVRNFFTGLLTIFSVMGATLIFALFLGAVLISIIFLIVWSIRGRK
jgi:thiosulfate dehydrogenase